MYICNRLSVNLPQNKSYESVLDISDPDGFHNDPPRPVCEHIRRDIRVHPLIRTDYAMVVVKPQPISTRKERREPASAAT
jgi:hypothetical protein